MRKPKPVKDKILTLRVTARQLESIEASAKQAGMKRTKYLEAIVKELHPVEEGVVEVGAYELCWMMSKDWKQQQNGLNQLTKCVFSVEPIREVIAIVVRLHDLAQEGFELLAKLKHVTVDRNDCKSNNRI